MNKKRISFDSEWEKIHSTQEWGQYPSEHIIRFIARNYYKKERKNIRILDFGCGGGAHTWYLAREGFDTYAFDGSESAVRNVKRKLEREGLNASLEIADALNIEYADDFFDSVIDNFCIYANKYNDICDMYKNVYNVLKTGGKFITSCFGKNTEGYGTGVEIEAETFKDLEIGSLAGRGTVHFFDRNSLEEILVKTGFREIMIDRVEYTDRGNIVEEFIATMIK